MKRRKFLRDIALAIAINLVPRVLQPIDSEIIRDNEWVVIEWWRDTYGLRDHLIPEWATNYVFVYTNNLYNKEYVNQNDN